MAVRDPKVIVGGDDAVMVAVIVTSLHKSVQGGFDMVHLKTLAPFDNPVIPEVGLVGLVGVPLPLIKVHSPVPVVGDSASIVAVSTVIFGGIYCNILIRPGIGRSGRIVYSYRYIESCVGFTTTNSLCSIIMIPIDKWG
jgi:hypothetical protein